MKKLILIDAHGLIHRAYHALPPLTTPKGEPIGAIYGLATMLLKIIKEHDPDYIAAAFDRPEPTFRKQKFEAYKAHRPPAPDELVGQFTKARELFGVLNIPVFEKAGYEADDIIATLVKRFAGKEASVVVVTGDYDTMQLVHDPDVRVETPKKGVGETMLYDEKAVRERFGVPPEKMTDYKGLVGDPSDNIPGVPGVGPKTAVAAIEKFNSIEEMYKKMKPDDPLAKKFLPHKKTALFSKELSILDKDVPVAVNLADLAFVKPSPEAIARHFSELGFKSLLARLGFTKNSVPEQEALIGFPAQENRAKEIAMDSESALVITESSNPKLLAEKKLKIAFDWKALLKTFGARGLSIQNPLFDIHIATWLLNPERKMLTVEEISLFLRARDSDEEKLLRTLYAATKHKLEHYKLTKIFEEIEMPLVRVLAQMELWGIGVNKEKLKKLHGEVKKETSALEKKIYAQAKTTFNINSPAQIAQVLSEKLGIKELAKRKTSSGQLKTGRDVLEEIADAHPIIPLILSYRENFKILSSFIEPLQSLIGEDGRIHTTYLQTGTATGRLSSEKPNLQNIPQESQWSEKLRSAFEAKRGWSLLSFDYAQMELRLLAHVSGDEEFKKAFRGNYDVHTETASRIFNVPSEKVTKAMRRIGKTLNFGVIYGMGARSFAKTSGVTLEEAKKAIEKYYSDFPDIKRWQEKTLAEVKEKGYAENIHGRKRWFDLQHSQRGEYERAAVNMPIQSFEADIIKIAMINSETVLEEKGLFREHVRLLLSTHDELLFEVEDDKVKSVVPLIARVMESAAKISVPLRVEAKIGKNWGSMKVFE
ncbi:MAG: DNA polymerase [Candidatus Jorgensenbacteria bacterium]|nr:DNA polymerase [Candidatus Jorgensenbacteria bacterium]